MVLRNKHKRVREHPSIPSTAYNPCVPCLGKIQAARGSLDSTRILSNSLIPLPGACVASNFPLPGIVFGPYTHDDNKKTEVTTSLLTIRSTTKPLNPFTEHSQHARGAPCKYTVYKYASKSKFIGLGIIIFSPIFFLFFHKGRYLRVDLINSSRHTHIRRGP